MRTTVIPAQITTVEDKIAANLNLTQILILMVPVFWTVLIYALLPQKMHLTLYKFPLVLIVLFICLALSLRIKGKVVLNWLLLLLRYNLRPRYYLFNKNDVYLREIDLPVFEKKPFKLFNFKKTPAKQKTETAIPGFAISDLVRVENLLRNDKFTLSIRAHKKGGMYVGFEQIQK